MNILSEATALQESDPPRALELLKKSIAANPNDSRPYAWAVVILYRQGRFQECRDVLNKARAHGVSTSEMMRNAMFKRVMDTESFNRKIPG